MLYLAIPAHNEAATIGVLLWRLRTVLAEFPREYEAVVYDDASTDSTPDILESYAKVMPLTVLRGERTLGYAGAVDQLVRHVSRHTRYPRRDAVLLLQGDFTDPPALIPEFVKRFEGGTDLVVGERSAAAIRPAPQPVRRLLRATPWLLKFFVKVPGIRDLTASYRLIRISVLRDLLRTAGDAPVCAGDTHSANADLLLRLVPLARRVEPLAFEPTWDVRLRESRTVPFDDALALLRWGWRARGRRAVPSTAPETPAESVRGARPVRLERDTHSETGADARPELRLDSRAEARGDSRSNWPADGVSGAPELPRNTAALDGGLRAARKNKSRSPLPVAGPDGEEDENARVVPLPTTGEKRPRRKRSRGARTEPRDGAEVALPVSRAENPAATERPLLRLDTQPADEPETVLSSSLDEAVADVEAALDDLRSARPARKKRRRRGGRGARSGGLRGGESDDAGDGQLAAPEAFERPAGEGPAGEGPAGEGPAGEGPAGEGPAGEGPAGEGPAGEGPAGEGPAGEGPADDAVPIDRSSASLSSRRRKRAAADETDPAPAEAGDGVDEEGDDRENAAGGGEPRARRRSRRGRRGGARRTRPTSADGTDDGAGGSDSLPTLPVADQ